MESVFRRTVKKKSKHSVNYVPLVNNFVTDPETYSAAGVAFTNGRHVLAGYQPHKKHPSISGIGGSKEDGESYMETALRECVEELFEPLSIPKTLLTKLASVAPQKVIQTGSYINVVYTFDDLEAMLKQIKRSGLVSPLYMAFPKTLTELIMNRIPAKSLGPEKAVEISHLALLPVVTHAADTLMDPYFMADMPSFTY
jgi:hypothetical protein